MKLPLKKAYFFLAALTILFLAVELTGVLIAFRKKETGITSDTRVSQNIQKDIIEQKKKIMLLKNRINMLSPGGIHIVVDTGKNRLYLKKGDKVSREAVVSCGSGNVLQDPSGSRTWVFETPRGEYSVRSRLVNPDWIKPDWAFIEEGESIPKNFDNRIESGVLGKYALGFGKGYFIHGTLYTRLLGRNVSHGCIRASDKDLEAIFNETPLGARIIIF